MFPYEVMSSFLRGILLRLRGVQITWGINSQ